MKYLSLCLFLLLSLACQNVWGDDDFAGKTITIVYANKWAPVSFEDENGKIAGLLPDRMEKLLGSGMGMKVRHIPVPWGRAQKMIQSGAADAFITTVTPARLDYSFASRAKVFILPFVPAVKKYSTEDHLLDNPDDLNNFKTKLFCDVLGNGWADYFYKDKDVQLHIAPTIKECLNLINAGRAHAVIHAQPVLEKYIDELGLASTIVVKKAPSTRSPKFSLLLSKKSLLGEEFVKAFDNFFLTYLEKT